MIYVVVVPMLWIVHHEGLEIVFHELKTALQQHMFRKVFETSQCVEKLTVKMVLHGDGDECLNTSEYSMNLDEKKKLQLYFH
jgi:hypothetical protein